MNRLTEGSPARRWASERVTPVARIRMRTSSGAGDGLGTSSIRRTSGGPYRSCTTAFTMRPSGAGRGCRASTGGRLGATACRDHPAVLGKDALAEVGRVEANVPDRLVDAAQLRQRERRRQERRGRAGQLEVGTHAVDGVTEDR